MRNILLFLTTVILFWGCSGPSTIPDRKMSLIIRDLLLTNSYNSLYGRTYSSDTIDFYTPILDKYGYTNADFKYSINKLALRKSSRITDIIDSAMIDIVKENAYFEGQKNLLLRIDSMVENHYRDTIYRRDSVIRLTSLSNRDRLRIKLPANDGRYELKYKYLIDSSDVNSYHSMRHYFTNRKGEKMMNSSAMLNRYQRDSVSMSINSDTSYKEYIAILNDYSDNAKKPDFSANDILIIYYKPLKETRQLIVRDKLNFDYRTHKPFKHELTKKDSSALFTVPPFRVDTTRVN